MNHKEMTDELNEQLTLLALGALDEVSAKKWQTHVSGCRVCQQELSEIRSTLALLGYSLPPVSPPPHLKAQVLEQVRASSATVAEPAWAQDFSSDEFKPQPTARETKPGAMPPPRRFWGWRLVTAFGVAAAVIGFGVYVNSLRQTSQEQETQIAALKGDIARQQELLAWLKSPQVTIVVMNGLEPSPQGHGKILWDSTRQKALLYVTNLPPPPGDKDYQLWQIVNNKPISAGVFNVRTDGAGFFKVDPVDVTDLKQINAFAVTLEPKGGVPQPTGQMYLMGKPRL